MMRITLGKISWEIHDSMIHEMTWEITPEMNLSDIFRQLVIYDLIVILNRNNFLTHQAGHSRKLIMESDGNEHSE